VAVLPQARAEVSKLFSVKIVGLEYFFNLIHLLPFWNLPLGLNPRVLIAETNKTPQ
jgi:hypothetical protein